MLVAVSIQSGWAQLNIIPKPVSVVVPAATGAFTLTTATPIKSSGDKELEQVSSYLRAYLNDNYHFTGKPAPTAAAGTIQLSLENDKTGVAGAYTLRVSEKGVFISGTTAQGVFYGVQSLIQLLPAVPPKSVTVPFVTIHDYPRFAYRGMHLDVSRHFFPVAFVKQYIDYLALHKMNYFHWHLTDDQGWRIEIKKYPRLTSVGGYRNGTITGHYPGNGNDNKPYGGFYTQEEIKEVVAYAAARFITTIPEIELPGHASAAIAAYPQLSCFPDTATDLKAHPSALDKALPVKKVQETWGVFEDVFCPSEYTFGFLQDVLDEVMALFPSQYIHIGGDECPKEAWKKSAFCQELMRKQGLKNEHELQSYFIQRIEKYINGKGRNIIGWDEILEGGLAPNATVMSWRGEKGGVAAAKESHYVIMTPGSHVYFDHAQLRKEDSLTIGGYTPIQKTYGYEPIPKELDTTSYAKYVLGAQANVWTEYLQYPTSVEYQVFPRIAALSEVLWSPKAERSWAEFEPRLQYQYKRYDLWKANYSKKYE